MKTLTTAMQTAVARTDGQGFRHLLQIDPDGTPLYLDCEGRKVGATQYTGELISVSPLDESMDSASDLVIEVLDTAANRAAIDLAVDVKLYLWALDTADTDKDLKLWGEISDPIVYAGGKIRFDIISRQSQQWNQSIGNPLLLDDYPGADPDEIGKTLPILYGEHKDHLCLAIDAGSIDNLRKELSISGTSVLVSDASSFPSSGTIQIDDEQITYDLRYNAPGTFYNVTRGANGTTIAAHDKGSIVAEVQTEYDYLVADHPVKSITNVKVDDVLQTGSDYSVKINDNGVAKIRFNTRPVIVKSVTIEVEDTIAVAASQPAHTHVIGTPTVTRQNTIYPNMAITPGGMTTAPQIINNRIKFPTLPAGVTGGSTTINVTGSSTIKWELGIWGGAGGIFSERVNWTVLLTKYGSYSGPLNIISDNLWIRKVTTTAANLILASAYRDVETASSMTPITPSIYTTRSGGVELTGNSVAETVIGKVVTCDVTGWADDGSGSITGSANSAISQPRHIVQHLLKTYGLATDAEVKSDDFPPPVSTRFYAGWVFKISVRIDAPAIIRDVIKGIEDQARSIITYTGGRWRMTNRPSSDVTPPGDYVLILGTDVKRNEDGSSSMRESRVGLRSVTNRHVYRAGLKSDGSWTVGGVKNALTSQAKYGIRQKNIDLPYLYDEDQVSVLKDQIGKVIDWLSTRQSNPNRKVISMEVAAALYALEVGDIVRYNSTEHGIDLYFECIAISEKGLTDSTITLEQI
jgi:hypothetical protein